MKLLIMRYLFIILLVISGSYSCIAQRKADTIKVYFDLAVPSLNSPAMHMLDSLAYYDILVPGKKYGIIGYADYLGSEESNIILSENRARAVQEYLTGLGVKPGDIETVTGKGEVTRDLTGNEGFPADRRVDIIPGGFRQPVAPKPAPQPAKPAPAATQTRIDISKVQKNETIRLDNIFFLPGSHRIREESGDALFNLYITMKDNPGLEINIEGHICCLTNTTNDGYDYDSQEYTLSLNRARTVYDYLVKQGIDKARMKYQGFGITKPLKWPERSVADENMNRRVEIRVLNK